jgi:hypothetical protein
VSTTRSSRLLRSSSPALVHKGRAHWPRLKFCECVLESTSVRGGGGVPNHFRLGSSASFTFARPAYQLSTKHPEREQRRRIRQNVRNATRCASRPSTARWNSSILSVLLVNSDSNVVSQTNATSLLRMAVTPSAFPYSFTSRRRIAARTATKPKIKPTSRPSLRWFSKNISACASPSIKSCWKEI